MNNMVKAKVTTVVETQEIVELPVISKKLLELSPAELVIELWNDFSIKEDCEVGVLVSDVPAGVTIRKPHGEQEYMRADDDWFRRTTKLEEERVLVIADGYRMSLMEGHTIVIAKLSDLYGCQWDLVAEELYDLHCPQ
jgi:hypothetical protein